MNLDNKSSKLIGQLLAESLDGLAAEFYSGIDDPELFATIMLAIAAHEKLIDLKPDGLERIKSAYDEMARVINDFVEDN